MVKWGFLTLHWAPWLGAAVAGFFTLSGLLAQVALQTDLQTAMQGVLENVHHANVLTRQTAQALAPLSTTASTLETMNGRLRTTAGDLVIINQTMDGITAQQRTIHANLGSLNERTGGVVAALGGIDARNKELLATTGGLTRQTRTQGGMITELSRLTGDSIAHLEHLNRKFRFLR